MSCEAVRALQDSDGCAVDGRCFPSEEPGMTTDVPGAICRTVGLADNRCTYRCGVSDDCPSVGAASTCNNGGVGVDYCGG